MRNYVASITVSLTTYIVWAALSLNLPMIISSSHADEAAGPQAMKEWTFLVYLNGHNNLDSFGSLNINQMEKVGSTSDINIVVQWASTTALAQTKRLLVQKDDDATKVTSPSVQDMGRVDMGDWRTMVEFVKWGVANYPAKHYFLDVWDHGSGWHEIQLNAPALARPDRTIFGGFNPMDISWDDSTDHHITTQQLGQAVAESAKAIGHKLDLFASDACLMAMAEVANEMASSVNIFAGSEETEPAAGWPYDTILKRWAEKPTATAAEVGGILADEYVKSYSGGSNGTHEATYSAFDMAKLPALTDAVSALGAKIMKLDATGRKALVAAAAKSTSFDYSDYVDLGDFMGQIEASRTIDAGLTAGVRKATADFVVANRVTAKYANAKGVAIWIPTSTYAFTDFANAYKALQFDQATHWSDALKYILQDAHSAQ